MSGSGSRAHGRSAPLGSAYTLISDAVLADQAARELDAPAGHIAPGFTPPNWSNNAFQCGLIAPALSSNSLS